jgi:hypothetical protein
MPNSFDALCPLTRHQLWSYATSGSKDSYVQITSSGAMVGTS